VFVLAGTLLLSMGGAIIAAPVTVPLMLASSRHHPTRAFRVAGAVLGALTIAEVAWALTYVSLDEAKPWIWLLPLVAAIATTAGFAAAPDARYRARTTG
jgi:hypothetical protein